MRVMEHIAVMDKEKTVVESFILLWDEILEKGQKIYMSLITVNLLKCLVMACSITLTKYASSCSSCSIPHCFQIHCFIFGIAFDTKSESIYCKNALISATS